MRAAAAYPQDWEYRDADDTRVILHRNMPGEHFEIATYCWCQPVVLSSMDERDAEELQQKYPFRPS